MDTVTEVADRVGRLDAGRLVEQGTVLELALDPVSPLGAALRRDGEPGRVRAGELGDAGRELVTVIYGSRRVPDDWLARLSLQLGSPLGLAGADVRSVDGVAVGHAQVKVPAGAGSEFRRAAADLGLSVIGAAGAPEDEKAQDEKAQEVVPV